MCFNRTVQTGVCELRFARCERSHAHVQNSSPVQFSSRDVSEARKLGSRQKRSDGAADVDPADGAVAQFWRAPVARDQMSARQEDRVDVTVHAHFTRLRLVKATILLHQRLLLLV